MLLLTRKPGEEIYIGDDIVVTVSKVNGNQVVIGVKAPKDIQVHRREIAERIERQKQFLKKDAA